MVNWINDKILINCLASSYENAQEIFKISNNHVLIGVLSKNYKSTKVAISDMKKYQKIVKGNISIGLGGGDPSMWERVALIAKEIKPFHINQIFTATGYTRALVGQKPIINSLISPSAKSGFVKISTGLHSRNFANALVPIETAIIMLKEQGANSIKFFNMEGLKYIDQFKEVAHYCAKHKIILEPTGGINLANFEKIIKIAIQEGVEKIIVHVYSSIIDQSSGLTNVKKVKKLIDIANLCSKNN